MGNVIQSKDEKKKKIFGLPQSLFRRLHPICTFEENISEGNSLDLDSYVPHIITSCSIASRLPENPLDIDAFRKITILPGQTPYFEPPELPSSLPPARKKEIIVQPTYPSLIPVLMTAKHAGIDTKQYNFVTYRNAFRKLAMNDEDFVINVMRIGSTFYVRRFSKYRISDKNNVGFRFEQMCTTKSDSNYDFNLLLDGQIGKFKILMMAETDAIRRKNNESVELKVKSKKPKNSQKNDWWLQAFLVGTKTVIHGRKAKDIAETISTFDEYQTSELGVLEKKIEVFNRLHCALQFLFVNVNQDRHYVLRGYKDPIDNRRVMALYEVTDKKDKTSLTFITSNLLNAFSVNSN